MPWCIQHTNRLRIVAKILKKTNVNAAVSQTKTTETENNAISCTALRLQIFRRRRGATESQHTHALCSYFFFSPSFIYLFIILLRVHIPHHNKLLRRPIRDEITLCHFFFFYFYGNTRHTHIYAPREPHSRVLFYLFDLILMLFFSRLSGVQLNTSATVQIKLVE